MPRGILRNPAAAACMLAILCTSLRPAAADEAPAAQDGWTFAVTPYLWAATLDLETLLPGIAPPSDGGRYTFFSLDNLEIAGFLDLAARKGRWSWSLDALHVSFADAATFGPLTVGADFGATVVELGGGYRSARFERLDIIAGARLVSIDVGLDLDPGPGTSQGKDWLDPYVGLAYRQPLGERWSLYLRGDLGGFGVDSDLQVNAIAVAAFGMSRHTQLLLGYRYLSMDFEDGAFLVDAAIQGALLGLRISF